jgi:hypothetical protein
MQDLRDKLYNYVKLVLGVSHYFQILAQFKSFQNKGAAYSNHTRVAIK